MKANVTPKQYRTLRAVYSGSERTHEVAAGQLGISRSGVGASVQLGRRSLRRAVDMEGSKRAMQRFWTAE